MEQPGHELAANTAGLLSLTHCASTAAPCSAESTNITKQVTDLYGENYERRIRGCGLEEGILAKQRTETDGNRGAHGQLQ